MDTELDGFKTQINLIEYAAGQGYVLDRKESSKNCAVMRHGDGDKVIIARGSDRHWVYFSVRDEHDNGSIIDFVQRRLDCSLGQVRQNLRAWAGLPSPIQPASFVKTLDPITKDRARVVTELARFRDLGYHRYLEEARHLSRSLLRSSRFAGTLKVDARANAVFPHADRDGPCGYELKNRTFTGFSRGGDKGLWCSICYRSDTTLVITESGIDALSYAALHPDQRARYASTGGSLNANQHSLIGRAIEKVGQGASAHLIIATDNDAGGIELADKIEAIALTVNRPDLIIRRDLPPKEGQDWNDVLRTRAGITPVARADRSS